MVLDLPYPELRESSLFSAILVTHVTTSSESKASGYGLILALFGPKLHSQGSSNMISAKFLLKIKGKRNCTRILNKDFDFNVSRTFRYGISVCGISRLGI